MKSNKQEQLVPRLRFRQFKSGWAKKSLNSLSSKIGSGITPRGGERVYTNEGILFIRSQNVNNNKLELGERTFIPQSIHKQMSNSKVASNDILLNITGASLGRTAIVPESVNEANVNQHVCIIRPTTDSSKFIQAWLSSSKGQKELIRRQTGSGREGLNFTSVAKIKIPIPKIKEQQKIASFLTAVDKRIEQLTKREMLLKEYKKGVIQKIFIQEVQFKDEKGAGFPKWKVKKLGNFASFTKGKGIPKKEVSINGKYPCIRYGELYTKYSEHIDHIYSKTNLPKEDLITSETNDVIVPSSGETAIDIARASAVTREGIGYGGDIIIIRSSENAVYLSYALNHLKKEVAKLAQGISVMHLYASQLQNVEIALPTVKEQEKIATYLTTITKYINKELQTVNYLQDFKKGLLQSLLI